MNQTFESVTAQTEKEVANSLTEYRASKGLPAIRLSEALSSAARYKAARRQAGEDSGAIQRDERPPLTRAQIVGGYYGEAVHEFEASGSVHAGELAAAITAAPGFEAACRDETVNEAGVGIGGSAFGFFCVVELGARKAAPVPVQPAARTFPEQIPADLETWGDALWQAPHR